MKKKGFTLIELLAVIVILAIIALIATPMIMNVIEKARRGAAIESVNGILESAETYRAEKLIDQEEYEREINLTNDILKYKGSKPESGTLLINEEGKMYIIAQYGNYCIEKTFEQTKPEVVERENCEIDKEMLTPKIYGIKRSLTTESTEWERTDNAVGLVANAQVGTTEVQNDFDTIYPWSDIKSYNYDTDSKEITAWYGEDNFRFKPEGNIEVLTYIPEFYYKRYQDEENEYILISKEKIKGYTKSDAFSVGRYTMSGNSTRVHSKSGYKPLTKTTITDFRNYARNLGEGFGQLDYHYFILQLLYLVEYADYNSQAKLGAGYTYEKHTGPTTSGGCDVLGMHSGSVDRTHNSSVIYRGIEDIFGNVVQFIDGINNKDYQAYICYDQSKYEIDKFDDCYQPLGYMNATSGGYGGYISKLGYDAKHPLISFPIEANGSAGTYISDKYYEASGNRLTFVGGSYSNGSDAGLWFWFAGLNSFYYDSVGARLLKIN